MFKIRHKQSGAVLHVAPHPNEEHSGLFSEPSNGEYEYANLRGAGLDQAALWGGDLKGAQLEGASLEGADLRKADLSGANLSTADLRGALLTDANLESASLRGADLRGANLEGANLVLADLGGADLRGAVLQCARFGGGAVLHGARFDHATVWPHGFWPRLFGAVREKAPAEVTPAPAPIDPAVYDRLMAPADLFDENRGEQHDPPIRR